MAWEAGEDKGYLGEENPHQRKEELMFWGCKDWEQKKKEAQGGLPGARVLVRLRVIWVRGEALGQVWHLRKMVNAKTGEEDVTRFFYALMSWRSASRLQAPAPASESCLLKMRANTRWHEFVYVKIPQRTKGMKVLRGKWEEYKYRNKSTVKKLWNVSYLHQRFNILSKKMQIRSKGPSWL